MKRNAWLWVVLALVVGAGIVWETKPLDDASARLAALPQRGAGWATRDLELTPQEQEVFGAARVVKRLAVIRGREVLLTVIDGSRNRHAVHDPSFCFRGAGWEVSPGAAVPLESGEARVMLLRKHDDPGQQATAVYWFTDGRRLHASPLRQWWTSALRRASFGASGPEPVLVTVVAAGAPLDWSELLAWWPELTAL